MIFINILKNKTILISPLDWGIGHASRCVPIIKILQDKKANVLLAGDGRAASFLTKEFPGLDHVHLEGYGIRYPKNGSMALSMLRQAPSVLGAVGREHRELHDLIDRYNIDAVISDNRFGLWSKKAYCVYITHQLMIKASGAWKMAEPLLSRMHGRYIGHYDECWIPDLPQAPGLAGDLSHAINRERSHFIGPLSRFSPRVGHTRRITYDVMAMISGPEPQRSIFEDMLMSQLKACKLRSLVVLGKPDSREDATGPHTGITVYPHLDSGQMREMMYASGLIVCRPGYTSIMDLSALGLQAAFVPTPGQTEQEYLAELHTRNKHFYSMEQKHFNIEKMLQESKGYAGINISTTSGVLEERIDHLLRHC